MDGSHHDWFEGRRAEAVLMVMIDDATSRIVASFFEEETLAAAFEMMQRYILRDGLPRAHGGRGFGRERATNAVWAGET